MPVTTAPASLFGDRSVWSRVLAWILFLSLHLIAGALILLVFKAALQRAPIPYPFVLFPATFATILLLLRFYFLLEVRGWRYSQLGGKLPRPIPATARQGEKIDSFMRIGQLRGAAQWTISADGLLINPFPFFLFKVFIPWSEIIAIRPATIGSLWAIVHRAEDVRSPILCTNTVKCRISGPGLPTQESTPGK